MKRFFTLSAAALILAVLWAGGFSAWASPKKANIAPPKNQGAAAAKSAVEDSSLSGKVVETMNGGSYTYICLEKQGKKTWVAVPEMKVEVGQRIALEPGMEMKNFPSKALGRTFESIYFSAGPLQAGEKKAAAPAKHEGSKAAVTKPTEKISVEKASGPDGYTVGEIFEKKGSLDKKKAIVHAKVVKVSSGIMGKNWIHLQDGTGDSAKGTHDLVATSQDSAAIGDVVTVNGTIFKDKDFGAGYKYDVIMEEASIQR